MHSFLSYDGLYQSYTASLNLSYAAPSILSYAAPTVELLPTISEIRCTLADEEILMKVDVQS